MAIDSSCKVLPLLATWCCICLLSCFGYLILFTTNFHLQAAFSRPYIRRITAAGIANDVSQFVLSARLNRPLDARIITNQQWSQIRTVRFYYDRPGASWVFTNEHITKAINGT